MAKKNKEKRSDLGKSEDARDKLKIACLTDRINGRARARAIADIAERLFVMRLEDVELLARILGV